MVSIEILILWANKKFQNGYLDNGRKEQKDLFAGNHWELPTNIDSVDQAIAEIEARLKAAGWEEDLTLISMAIKEALVNAIIHGNLAMPKPKEGNPPQYDSRKTKRAENRKAG